LSKSTELYKRAKEIIPGGNQLLSKRPEMFLPNIWPAYYKKAKGINVWDLDGKKYSDMSIMGIGTCSLGYANDAVNKAVINSTNMGSVSTLNCREEVQLAEKLIELHPFADMVRFSRTGGEATSIAIRIARTASGKSKIAMCGYHSWHDWYLAANLGSNENLDNQLLPGLKTNGIPKELKGTTLPFVYGDIEGFKKIIHENKNEIGAIVTEVQRGRDIDLAFLKAIKSISSDFNIPLIFDEVSSGFRLSMGGLCKLHNIFPDIICLGKAMGNGFAISAVLGKREIMESAQESFISSTYWTERTGYAAALETINQFEKLDAINRIIDLGKYLDKSIKNLISDIGLKIEMGGLITIPSLIIKEDKASIVKTYITQEMLKKGFLASNITYLSYCHSEEKIKEYLKNLAVILNIIKKNIDDGNNLYNLIDDEICHTGFKRLAKF
jgi:glutamate-1-semialdehyde 2,1-aminomutase